MAGCCAACGRSGLVDVDHLVEARPAPRLSCRPVRVRIEMTRHRGVERVVDQRRLARSRDAGHAHEQAHRAGRPGDVLQVVARRPDDAMRRAGRTARGACGHRDAAWPARYWPVSECAAAGSLAGVPCATTARRGSPAPGPMSTTWSAARIMSSSCSDDDHAVAEVAQVLKRADQPVVVALVQADDWARRARTSRRSGRADLRGERMRCASPPESVSGAAVRCQVVQADVVEELQPRAISRTTGRRSRPARRASRSK